MASSIILTSNSLYGRYIQFKCEQISTNPVTNKSTAKWTLSTKGANGSSVSVSAVTCKVNGTTVAAYGRAPYTTHTFPAYGEQDVSGTIEIAHNSDGTKSVTVSLAANYNDTWSPIEQSQTWTMNAIPRIPYLTQALNFSSAGDPAVRYSNPLGTAVTTLQACVSLDGTTPLTAWTDIDKEGATAYLTLTSAERGDLITATPGTSRTVYYLMRYTVNGTNGTDTMSATFTVAENALTKPTVSIAANAYSAGLSPDFDGMCIKGKSSMDVVVTAAGKYGATITDYATTVNGVVYDTASFRSAIINTPGTLTITTTVTDSRGFTNTATYLAEVYDYYDPSLMPVTGESEVLCYRADSSGNPDNTSTAVWFKGKVNFASLENVNVGHIRVRSRISGGTWGGWTTLTLSSNAYSGAIPGTFAITNSYEVQVEASDDVGGVVTSTYYIPTEDVPLDLGRYGKSVGIGRYADTNKPYSLSVGWDAYFDEGIYIKQNTRYVNIMELIYPVGCLYWSADPTNPAQVFGIGTWTQITDTFVLAAGSTYTPASPAQYTAQGGEATHTLTVAELPAHSHGPNDDMYYYTTRGADTTAHPSEINGVTQGNAFDGTNHGGIRRTQSTGETGGDTAHNNMPPYLVRYCWQRTA